MSTKSLDLSSLRARLEVAGAFRKRTAATTVKLAICLAVATAGMLGPIFAGTMWLFWVLLPVSALFLTAAVMMGHEGGHKSFSNSSAANEAILHLVFPFIGGLSASYWKHKHNVLHHTQPNIDGVDDDLDLWPMAGSRRQHEASGPFRKFLQKHLQVYLFWPLSSMLAYSMRFTSISFLVRKAKEGKMNGYWWLDAACLAGHYAMWLVVPPLVFGASFGMTLAVYAGVWGVIGLYLTAIFAPAHMGLPIYRSHDDTWRLQLEVTRNLSMPGWLRFFFIGLDQQVEHHLFMRMPHQNMPAASPIVKEWAEQRGLPYQEINFFAALVDVTRFVKRSWQHDTPAVETRGEEGRRLAA